MAAPTMTAGKIGFWHPATLIATAGGIGLLPKAPGTWASLAALPLAWILDHWIGRTGLAVAGAAIALLGVWASHVYVRHQRGEDPGEVVVDEVAAQLLVLAAAPLTWATTIAGFVLFRLFDIVKPWPVGWADRRVKGGLGVMLDDLLAALYAGGVLALLSQFTGSLIDVS
jgi:phosphatidylglycerophosphatase A